MKIAFLIPTYNRPRSLLEIVQKIHKLGDVYILDDCSDNNYNFLLKYKVNLYRNEKHQGKAGFYKTVSDLFELVIGEHYDYYFFMPDDLIPVNDFHLKAIETYNEIKDNRKMCLNLLLEKSRFMKACWTDFVPIDKGVAYLTNWVDMCFVCERKMLQVLNYNIPNPEIDYKAYPTMSSGVGRYISKYLVFKRRSTIYQVKKSLFRSAPENLESKMHPHRHSTNSIYKEIL